MTKGNSTHGRAAPSRQEEPQWRQENTVIHAYKPPEELHGPVSFKRPQRSLLSRKSIWVLLLALGTAFVLKQYGSKVGVDSSSVSRLIGKITTFREKRGEAPDADEDEDVGAPPVPSETEPNEEGLTGASSLENDKSSEVFSSGVGLPEDGEDGLEENLDEDTASEEEEDPVATLLKAAAPMFVRPEKKFAKPKTSAEKWANRAVELVELLEEKAGPEAAEAFVALLAKDLPTEQTLELTTDVLAKEVVEIRKQVMARLANKCFQARLRREEAYATYAVMEQHFLSLERHVAANQELPEYLAKVCDAFQGEMDLSKEEEQLASARARYEELLVKEKVSLEALFYHLTTFTGHIAAIEIIQKLDEQGGEWKSKLPRVRDAGTFLGEAAAGKITEMPPVSAITSVSAALTTARARVFETGNAGFKAVAKLAEIVGMRKAITRNFSAAIDPELEGLTPQMLQNVVVEAYELMDAVAKLQDETVTLLKSRDGKSPLLEPWLALIL